MRIAPGSDKHLETWARLRTELWPDGTFDVHREDLKRLFLSGTAEATAFLAIDDADGIAGFAEATLRHDFVNGCSSSPVLFLEGIYVRPQARRKGVARLLCAAVAKWGKAKGCTEFGSDALLDNVESQAFHQALGFGEAERVIFFHKTL
jgi:aminoglycoside 6'-N-acetyltransferase I